MVVQLIGSFVKLEPPVRKKNSARPSKMLLNIFTVLKWSDFEIAQVDECLHPPPPSIPLDHLQSEVIQMR